MGVCKIIVVEDHKKIRGMLTDMLNDNGYEAIGASNGKQALALVEELSPQMVLLDVAMDGMDGIEVCKQIKKNDRTKHIKVVMLSAMTDLESRRKGVDAGAEKYICKPVRMAKILEELKRI